MVKSDESATRRAVLGAASALAVGGLAGCSSLLDGGSDAPTDTATSAPTPTPSPTATPSPSPTPTPDRPSIERQVVQRDKAAITHIRRTVTGEARWPTLASYDRVDPALLGVWAATEDEDRVAFSDDATFTESGPDFERGGEYAAYRGELHLAYDSGETFTFGYRITQEGGDTVVEFSNDEGVFSTYTKTEDREDERTTVERFEDLIIVEAESPETERQALQAASTGSGFIVTPDGHVVTNAHVVGADEDPQETLFFRLATRTREAIRSTLEEDFDLTESERQQAQEVLFDKLFSYYAETARVRNVKTNVGVLHGRAPPDENLEVRSWSATVETAGTVRETVGGEPTWGRDVAILSVDADSPLPTVPLGDSNDLGTGEKVFVIGYPDIGVQQIFEDRNTVLEPTLTSGVVSARRTLNSGIETIQTDAGINGGNSGGPIYDANGEVVGIATFKPADLDLEEVAFGLPVETAKGFMTELGIENTPGELTETYREGLNAFWRGDCEDVRNHMERVLELWPEHPYAREFIENC